MNTANTCYTCYTLDLKAILPALRAEITADGEPASPIGIGIDLKVQQTQVGVQYRPFKLNWLGEVFHLQAPVEQFDDIFALEGEFDGWDCFGPPEAHSRAIALLKTLEAKWLQ